MTSKVDINSSVFKLAYFIPFGEIDVSQPTKKDLVINSLFILNKAVDLATIQTIIQQSLGCDIGTNELDELLAELVKEDIVHINKNKYFLTIKTNEEMSEQVNRTRLLQEKVLTNWIDTTITPKYGEQSAEFIANLKENLVSILNRFFLNHTQESKRLIDKDFDWDSYKENPTISELIKETSFKTPELKEIAIIEIPLFIGSNEADIQRFLNMLCEKAFRYLTTICDPHVITKLKEALAGKVLYIDTNTIYRLVNLQGEQRYKLTKEVIHLCREFGFKLKVSYETLQEIYKRIDYDSRVLKSHNRPTSLADVAYRYRSEDNFISAFWRSQRGNPEITIDEFIQLYRNVDYIIESEDEIEVERTKPPYSEAFLQRWTDILSKINIRDDHKKSDYSANHDAYLFALVENLRSDKLVERFIDSPAWILTTDHFFMRFQSTEYILRESNKAPFALLPSHLIQILRFVTPTDNKFNEMFLEVFSKTYIPLSIGLTNEQISQILERISKYKGYTPLLAEKLLSDSFFIGKFKKSESDGETEEIIHETLIELASEMQHAIEDKTIEVSSLKEQIQQIGDHHTKVLKDQEEALTGARLQYEKAQAEAATTQELLSKMERKEDERNKRNKRILIAIIIIVYLVMCYFVFNYIGKNNSLNNMLKFMSAAGLAIPLGVFMNIFLRGVKSKELWIAIISLIFTLAFGFYSLML